MARRTAARTGRVPATIAAGALRTQFLHPVNAPVGCATVAAP